MLALKRNTTLQKLTLDDNTAQCRCGTFGEAMAVNASLEELRLLEGQVQESDLYDLSTGLRRNRTLKVLQLPEDGLTPQGLRPLVQIARYENSTLEKVFLPFRGFQVEQARLDLACHFHRTFRASCQALRAGGAADPRDDAEASALQQWWPVLGSNHPTVKATVVFCVARVRAEVVAQSLRATSPSNRPGDGIATSSEGTFTRAFHTGHEKIEVKSSVQ